MTATESLPALEAVRRELEIDEQAPGGHPQVRAVRVQHSSTAQSRPARPSGVPEQLNGSCSPYCFCFLMKPE